METISQQLPVDEGQAALIMAVGIVLKRLGQLSEQDQNDAYEMFKAYRDAKTPEEIEEVRCTLYEILDQEPVTAKPMKFPAERPEKLVKWSEHIGQRVQSLRNERNWTQADLAAKAGLTDQAYVSRVERGDISPSRHTIEKLAHAFGVEVGAIDPTED